MATFRSLCLWLFDVKRKPFSLCLHAVFRFFIFKHELLFKSEIIEIEWQIFTARDFLPFPETIKTSNPSILKRARKRNVRSFY